MAAVWALRSAGSAGSAVDTQAEDQLIGGHVRGPMVTVLSLGLMVGGMLDRQSVRPARAWNLDTGALALIWSP